VSPMWKHNLCHCSSWFVRCKHCHQPHLCNLVESQTHVSNSISIVCYFFVFANFST